MTLTLTPVPWNFVENKRVNLQAGSEDTTHLSYDNQLQSTSVMGVTEYSKYDTPPVGPKTHSCVEADKTICQDSQECLAYVVDSRGDCTWLDTIPTYEQTEDAQDFTLNYSGPTLAPFSTPSATPMDNFLTFWSTILYKNGNWVTNLPTINGLITNNQNFVVQQLASLLGKMSGPPIIDPVISQVTTLELMGVTNPQSGNPSKISLFTRFLHIFSALSTATQENLIGLAVPNTDVDNSKQKFMDWATAYFALPEDILYTPVPSTSPLPSLPGCTDALALNFNPGAEIDDGSCSYPIEGFTEYTGHSCSGGADLSPVINVGPNTNTVGKGYWYDFPPNGINPVYPKESTYNTSAGGGQGYVGKGNHDAKAACLANDDCLSVSRRQATPSTWTGFSSSCSPGLDSYTVDGPYNTYVNDARCLQNAECDAYINPTSESPVVTQSPVPWNFVENKRVNLQAGSEDATHLSYDNQLQSTSVMGVTEYSKYDTPPVGPKTHSCVEADKTICQDSQECLAYVVDSRGDCTWLDTIPTYEQLQDAQDFTLNYSGPTLAPFSTPSAPTQSPVVTTQPPIVTTQPPVVTTQPPVVTTQSPVFTPVVTTQPPIVTTQPPVVTTQPPIVTTQPPVVTTHPPIVTIQPPVVTTQPPIVTTQPPVFTTQPPVVTTQSPVFTPVVTTQPPVVTTQPPVVTTQPPIVTTQSPVFTPVVTTQSPVFTPVVTTQSPVFTPVVTTQSDKNCAPGGTYLGAFNSYGPAPDVFSKSKISSVCCSGKGTWTGLFGTDFQCDNESCAPDDTFLGSGNAYGAAPPLGNTNSSLCCAGKGYWGGPGNFIGDFRCGTEPAAMTESPTSAPTPNPYDHPEYTTVVGGADNSADFVPMPTASKCIEYCDNITDGSCKGFIWKDENNLPQCSYFSEVPTLAQILDGGHDEWVTYYKNSSFPTPTQPSPTQPSVWWPSPTQPSATQPSPTQPSSTNKEIVPTPLATEDSDPTIMIITIIIIILVLGGGFFYMNKKKS